ncbi:MAG: ABC transporter ATP-binding protein/permease [Clostridiales bacterium]|nr:ABC transporter ATP-binding protein/permease [Clostridiales bacterium]
MKRLMAYIGKYKKYAIATPFVMIGEVLMELLIPLVMAAMIDKGISSGDVQYTVKMGLLMILMAIVSLCFGSLGSRFGAVASMGFAKNVRRALFEKVQSFSFSNVDKFSTASLVTRLTTDVNNVQNAFNMMIRMVFRAPIMMVGALIMAIKLNAQLALVFLVAIPILCVGLYLIMTNAHPRFKAMLEKYDALNSDVQENLIAIRVVKAFVREKYESDKFDNSAEAVRATQYRAEKLVQLNQPLMQICMYGCTVAALWFGGNMVIGGTFQIGALSSFIGYISQTLMSLMMVSMILMMTIISRASITRINEVLDETPDISDSSASTDVRVEDGSIVFKDVAFSYNKKQKRATIENINLKIPSGTHVGIIGGTGSAKSTLVQLIPRLYDADKGEVIVGGHDVRDYKLHVLRDDVAMVLQKNVLFSGTIAENLRWGNEHATQEEIEAACRSAQADDFIKSFPDGYETELGQGGVNVSGGQKQRLCIARALIKKPKIVIMDDSTSAVDTATDARLREAIHRELKDTTSIIIAQRITSIADCDMIIVMDDGHISDVGTHDELMKRSEIYREVYQSQQMGVA